MTTLIERQQFWDKDVPYWTDHKQFEGEKERLIGFVREGLGNLLPHIREKKRILNIGSGANNGHYFDGLVSPEAIVALDISHGMLLQNNAKNKIQNDAERVLPIRTDSIDMATSFYVMRYLNEDGQVNLIHEIHRVLRPGGRGLRASAR